MRQQIATNFAPTSSHQPIVLRIHGQVCFLSEGATNPDPTVRYLIGHDNCMPWLLFFIRNTDAPDTANALFYNGFTDQFPATLDQFAAVLASWFSWLPFGRVNART